ncbi:MAG: ATP-binding protein [Alphaproteobacteria bacterium]|nr:ATP-binding protein [Alphaproteobacteria bacterium]
MSGEAFYSEVPSPTYTKVGEAVLTEAVRHVDIIHTSLAGMTAIVLLLIGALSLPLFGLQPVTHIFPLIVMIVTVFVGISVLYYMNYRVHHHVANQAALTEVLVNSLGQGFLNFDQKGNCGIVYSQACADLLETVPAGKNIAEVLRVPESQLSDFRDWLDILFLPYHALGFDDVVSFLPQLFPHSENRRICLTYRPIRNKSGALKQVVLIATDQTEEYTAVQQAKQKQIFAEMICRIFKERNQFQFTLAHLRDFIAEANSPNVKRSDAQSFLRQLHTMKAAVRHFSLVELGEVVHQMEIDLRSPSIVTDEQFRKQLLSGRQKLSTSLDHVMGEVRGLIGNEHDWHGTIHEIEEAQLYSFATEMQGKNVDPEIIQHFLQSVVSVPINDSLRSFEIDLFDLINIKNKQLKPINFVGTNPRVMTLPIRNFLFSLTHICRNIADHGIEAPSVRVARGKDAAGLVTVSTSIADNDKMGKCISIVISDDGNGIDPVRIREKLSVSMPDEDGWRNEDDHSVIQHVFDTNFTTRDNVTELSGRGVGLEAVALEVESLGGTIVVNSVLGSGTSFDIKIPYRVDLGFMSKNTFSAA